MTENAVMCNVIVIVGRMIKMLFKMELTFK